MPNSNYKKGYRKEREVVNDARDVGLIAFRSAGSHSPIDVCIIDKKEKKISFIQCKPDTMSEKAKQRLKDEQVELNDEFMVSFDVL